LEAKLIEIYKHSQIFPGPLEVQQLQPSIYRRSSWRIISKDCKFRIKLAKGQW